MSMIMTEKAFQDRMKDVVSGVENKSLFDKFVEIIKNILSKSLGVDFKSDGITAQGIATTLEIIEKSTGIKITSKEMQNKADEALLNERLMKHCLMSLQWQMMIYLQTLTLKYYKTQTMKIYKLNLLLFKPGVSELI